MLPRMGEMQHRRRPWLKFLIVMRSLELIVVAAGAALGWFTFFLGQGVQTAARPSSAPPPPSVRTVILRGSGTAAAPVASNQVHVLGGDTVRVPGAPDYRLVGCDAPETVRAKCQSERTTALCAFCRKVRIASEMPAVR